MSEHLLYIGGAWRHGGGGTIPAVSPSSGEPFATVAMADRGDVDAAVAAARACPAGRPYSGLPLIAFIAHRPMPGNQPDSYIIEAAAPRLAVERQAAAADVPRCP